MNYLADEYTRSFPDDLGNGDDAAQKTEMEKRHKAMAFELNSSEKYLAIKEELKRHAIAVIEERYKKKGERHVSILHTCIGIL